MSTLTIDLPKLHPGQERIKGERARFNALDCGRRWGKNVLGRDLIVEPGLEGYPVAWYSPTYKDLLEDWSQFTQLLHPIIKRKSVQERRLELFTGGTIELWAFDTPDVSRGRKYKRAVIDEAAKIRYLEQGWNEAIRPTLTDYQGDAFFLSTPKGRNFFFTLYTLGQDPERPEWKSWKEPTSNNPFIPDEEIEAARRELPERVFQQEYLAEFLEGEGAVFRNILACMKAPKDPMPADHAQHHIVAGLDWGKHNDFTTFSVGCATCNVEIYRDRFNKIDYAFQRNRVKVGYERFNVSAILAERNAMGEPNIEQLSRDGIRVMAGPDGLPGFNTTASTKPPLIENLALVFEREEWQFQADPLWTAELEAYERKMSAITGRSQYSAPEGMHDDTVIARALMVWAGRRYQPLGEQATQKSKWREPSSEGSRFKRY